MIISTTISAWKGFKYWHKIKRRFNIDDNKRIYVIIMPDSEREINKFALSHIDDFLTYHRGKGVVILTVDEWTLTNASQYSNNIVEIDALSEEDYKNLYS